MRTGALSYARRHAVAFLALFVALGGGAYAASGLVSGGTITGCVKSHGGPLTIVRTGHKCPRHQVALTFDQRGPAGRTGAAGPAGPRGATGQAGPAASGTTVLTDPPGWAVSSDSFNLTTSTPTTSWDGFEVDNPSLDYSFQTLPVTLAQLNGAAPVLQSFSFCYGAQHSKISSVEVDAITQPAALTSAALGQPPGGTKTTALIKQTTSLGSQGCQSYTPTTTVSLSGSTYLVASVVWAPDANNLDYVFLGHTTWTFAP